MTDVRGSWSEVGDRVASLALKLKLHVEEELSEPDEQVDERCDRVRSKIDEVLDALRDAGRDPAVRADVSEVVEGIGVALDATLREARRALADRA